MIRFSFLLLLLPLCSFSQSIGIGQWRNHVSMNNAFFVDAGDHQIFAATSQGVAIYNTSDQSIQVYSKTDRLSDVNIKSIRYDKSRQLLLVGYENGNLDILSNNDGYNLADIKRANVAGDKSIRNICLNGNYAYLATGFAIIVIDLVKKEVSDTYKFGTLGDAISVNDVAVFNGSIYAATDQGLYSASLQNPFLNNFENWTRITAFSNPTGKFNQVESFANSVYVNYANPGGWDEVYFLDNQSSWARLTSIGSGDYSSLKNSGEKLLFTATYNIVAINTENELLKTISSTTEYNLRAADAIEVNGQTWIADNGFGLLSVSSGGKFEKHTPSGPLNNKVVKLSSSNGKIYVATGSVNQIFVNDYHQDGILVFERGSWSYLDETNSDSLKPIFDFLSITPDPNRKSHFYACSWGGGLVEVLDNQVTQIYNARNSTIQEFPLVPGNYRIASASYDLQGNLWVANSCAPNNLVLKSAANEWYSFKMGNDFGNANGILINQILVASDNSKWMIRHRNGLYVYNENGTFTSTGDDQMRSLSTTANDGGLPSNEVYCLAQDLDGEIWLGSDKGFAIIYNPSAVLSNEPVNADQPIIQQDGNFEKVLEQEIILAIAVDGANRKWMATQNSGVYLLSEDGTKQIFHFTAENSPLLSNEVLALTIDDKSGEVFFGTTLGIQSFMSDATAPEESLGAISVYPSPVKPEYTGPIAMRGFVRDTDVKIADISGNVIFQTRSLGGEAIWDGKNFKGERVATGVYLIFAAGPTGEESTIGKILYLH